MPVTPRQAERRIKGAASAEAAWMLSSENTDRQAGLRVKLACRLLLHMEGVRGEAGQRAGGGAAESCSRSASSLPGAGDNGPHPASWESMAGAVGQVHNRLGAHLGTTGTHS